MAITYHYEQLKALDLKFSTKKRSDIYFKGMCVLVVQLCPILCDSWTGAHQTPLSMGFSRQEYWSGLPFPPPGDLPNPGIKSGCLLHLLHYRRIVYPLSHERNGNIYFKLIFKTVLTESVICHCRMDIWIFSLFNYSSFYWRCLSSLSLLAFSLHFLCCSYSEHLSVMPVVFANPLQY